MVGEIRDEETMEIALHAAMTGHLVLSTLHTNSAAASIPRLLDMGAEPFFGSIYGKRNCGTAFGTKAYVKIARMKEN